MAELENVFAKGTQGLMVNGKFVHFPVNEDWPLVGEITSHNSGVINFKKIWDKAASPEIYEATAKYAGKSGVPSRFDVGACLPFNRAVLDSKNFASFNGSLLLFGIPALVVGPASFSRVDYTDDVNTALALGSATCWQETDLKRITSYKVYDRDSEAIQVIAEDSKKILVKKGQSLVHFRDTVIGCTTGLQSNKVFRLDIAPALIDGSESAWCVDDIAALDPGVLCCGAVAHTTSCTIEVEYFGGGGYSTLYRDAECEGGYKTHGDCSSYPGVSWGIDWYNRPTMVSFGIHDNPSTGECWAIYKHYDTFNKIYWRKDINPTDPDEPNGTYTYWYRTLSDPYPPAWKLTIDVKNGAINCP